MTQAPRGFQQLIDEHASDLAAVVTDAVAQELHDGALENTCRSSDEV